MRASRGPSFDEVFGSMPDGEASKQVCDVCADVHTWYVAGKKQYCAKHKEEANAEMKRRFTGKSVSRTPPRTNPPNGFGINIVGMRRELPREKLIMDRPTYGTL